MRKLFLICYDLRFQRSYLPLWNELERLGASRAGLSDWWLEISGVTAEGLRNHLARFIDSDDRVLVVLVADWAGLRLEHAPSNAVPG